MTFVDADAAVKARYASGVDVDDLTPCGEVATVLRLAPPGNAMTLFLVNSLNSQQGGYTVVGQDGTIPGPASVGGTVASGALVSIANLTFTSSPTACQGAINLSGCGADLHRLHRRPRERPLPRPLPRHRELRHALRPGQGHAHLPARACALPGQRT